MIILVRLGQLDFVIGCVNNIFAILYESNSSRLETTPSNIFCILIIESGMQIRHFTINVYKIIVPNYPLQQAYI